MKSSVMHSSVQINDKNIDDIEYLEPYTLYINPYYVVTELKGGDKVSKHYYMNTQRVATDISINYQAQESMAGPLQPDARDPKKPSEDTASVNYNAAFADLQATLNALGHQKLDVNGLGQQPTLEEYYPELVRETAFNSTAAKNAPESTTRVLFWYHPDYLGNVDLVTERDGRTYEFFTYNPWGEEMHQYNANTFGFSSPYRFNSKEKDAETGLYYYGARYYDPKNSVWLSVDKMASWGPNISPYAFSHNNPVMMVDPDGNWPFWLGVTTTYFEARASAGVGVLGAHALVQSGVARDEVGKTHFTNRTTVAFDTLKGRDATLSLGAMASAMGGVSQDFDTETYLGQSFESSATVTAGAAAGLSVSVSAGERGVGVSAGIGLGTEVSMYETETLESISLTWDQSDNVNSQATSGNTSWSVDNRRQLDDGAWVGNVSICVGKNKVTTDTLRSTTAQKPWMS